MVCLRNCFRIHFTKGFDSIYIIQMLNDNLANHSAWNQNQNVNGEYVLMLQNYFHAEPKWTHKPMLISKTWPFHILHCVFVIQSNQVKRVSFKYIAFCIRHTIKCQISIPLNCPYWQKELNDLISFNSFNWY